MDANLDFLESDMNRYVRALEDGDNPDMILFLGHITRERMRITENEIIKKYNSKKHNG